MIIVCNLQNRSVLTSEGELLFLEDAVWDLWGISENKPSSLPKLAQGEDGQDNANSPDYDAGASLPLSRWA